MNFNESSLKIYNHIKTLEQNSPVFFKSILSYSTVLEKLFPKEFNQKLIDLKLDSLIETMNAGAGEMMKQIDRFNLDLSNKIIEVTLGSDTLSSPMVDLSSFIVNNLNLDKNSENFFIALSYLCRQENFELFQITQGVILG